MRFDRMLGVILLPLVLTACRQEVAMPRTVALEPQPHPSVCDDPHTVPWVRDLPVRTAYGAFVKECVTKPVFWEDWSWPIAEDMRYMHSANLLGDVDAEAAQRVRATNLLLLDFDERFRQQPDA